MSQSTTITASVDPSNRLALAALRRHLTDESTYSLGAIVAIVAHVAEHSTLDDAPFVYPADLDALTAAYVAGFEPVDQDDPSWGSPEGREFMGNPLDDVCSIEPNDVPDAPDAPDFEVTQRPDYWEGLAADGITPLPAISGGSLDDIPPHYEPTPEDWAEYRRIFDEEDRAPAPAPAAPNRFSPESLLAFRKAAWGV